MAVSYASQVKADLVVYGAHYSDASLYPDCSIAFVEAFDVAAREGTGNHGFRVYAPFVGWTKQEIVDRGFALGVPFELTWSCYKGGEVHCGTCKSCIDRQDAFVHAGIEDPTRYAETDALKAPIE